MNHNKVRVIASLGGLYLSLASALVWAEPVLDYKLAIADDGKSYEVWMRPSTTPKPNINLTGQLTLKVPHQAAFKAVKVVPAIEGADWIEASRVDAPPEDPEHDYISFSFVGVSSGGAQAYPWAANQEQLVFSFANEKGCVEGVHIMPADDPFNIASNSANTNPGNQFTNLGWGAVGENNFNGVYGETPTCVKQSWAALITAKTSCWRFATAN